MGAAELIREIYRPKMVGCSNRCEWVRAEVGYVDSSRIRLALSEIIRDKRSPSVDVINARLARYNAGCSEAWRAMHSGRKSAAKSLMQREDARDIMHQRGRAYGDLLNCN